MKGPMIGVYIDADACPHKAQKYFVGVSSSLGPAVER